MISASALLRIIAVANLVMIVGCSSATSRNPVKGSVSYDGQPVDYGGIAFIPEGAEEGEQRLRATGKILDGRYDLDANHGPNPGKYRVQIWWQKKTGKRVQGEGPGAMIDETKQVIPPKHNTESKLIVEVESGRNTFDFDLKD